MRVSLHIYRFNRFKMVISSLSIVNWDVDDDDDGSTNKRLFGIKIRSCGLKLNKGEEQQQLNHYIPATRECADSYVGGRR